ncbi:putative extracellular elastinolytic metallo proteinase precursor [Chytriomyces cf. hyalinus JEL632]|nr:putative extracellular elastinolytic metallo proteinase precursor [Chytriomyces cf. hyalinus JEL632]
MHAPAFFLSLLTLCALPIHAAPLSGRAVPALPGFEQPESVSIDLSLNMTGLAARDGPQIDAVSAAATDALAKSLNLSKDQIKVSHAHTSTTSGIHHVHFVQVVDGVEVSNAVANVNVKPDGSILSVYSSFVPVTTTSTFAASERTAGITADIAVQKFAKSKGFSANEKLTVKQDGAGYTVSGASFVIQDIKASKKIYQKGSELVPVWDLSVDLGDKWHNVFVNIKTGEVIAVSDWTSDISDATYAAVPRYSQAPSGSRLTQIKNPWNLKASPNGWHVIKGTERKDLYGNNVAAASNPNGGGSQTNSQVLALSRPSSNSLTFNYALNDRLDAMNPTNINAAVTNMFVATNTAHDLFYNYGFTESAGNFQFDNLGRGGREGDGVIATCQDRYNTDSGSRNNANFATPPDGQNGRMRMYVFDVTNPTRDGAFDNGIVYHEFGHGLSNRLTGGSSNSNCLSGTYSGGMGEGWSDVWAVILTLPPTATRATNVDIGKYVLGGNKGIRRYPYSTSLSVNPLKYSRLASLNEVHDIGEVWCNALYEVLWNMVDISGFLDPSGLISGQASGKGNADFITIVVQGMKNQPCNPTFLQARDAILQADQVIFNGKYKCAIWKGFAKRGMGVNARNGGGYVDNSAVPTGC